MSLALCAYGTFSGQRQDVRRVSEEPAIRTRGIMLTYKPINRLIDRRELIRDLKWSQRWKQCFQYDKIDKSKQ
jgi:hypothetical protein